MLGCGAHEAIFRVAAMTETTVVSSRGQITLPARMRKKLGIRGGDVLVLEDRGHEIALTPGAIVQIDYYSDEQVAEWDREDQLTDGDRQRIIKAVTRGA